MTFSSEEIFSVFLVFIGVFEVDFDQRGSSSGVMKDGSDHTSDVALSLGEVEVTISGGSDSFRLGGGVNTALFTFSLAYVRRMEYIG